ncbi:hypothetical protein [Peptoniphilus raoultii]|uniref:hypothetical protein n=1 Tax=Peptoniphilus raoultii TaxID=1776387 RepID=UPI0008D95D0F|nr:hypothetical protein [Peptoniphilus raoultii]
MFGKTESTFPNATYTITFPEKIKVDTDKVVAKSNTSTVSKIEVDAQEHSVKFTFNLGSWNDYEGFFKLVESELDSTGKTIYISIPYTIEGIHNPSDISGIITGFG